MKKVSAILATRVATTAVSTVLIGLATSLAFADIRIDEAVKLQESGKIKSFDELNQVVLKHHPDANITDSEVEDAYGRYVYQVELLDKSGQEWDLDIDATSGEVLKSQKDD